MVAREDRFLASRLADDKGTPTPLFPSLKQTSEKIQAIWKTLEPKFTDKTQNRFDEIFGAKKPVAKPKTGGGLASAGSKSGKVLPKPTFLSHRWDMDEEVQIGSETPAKSMVSPSLSVPPKPESEGSSKRHLAAAVSDSNSNPIKKNVSLDLPCAEEGMPFSPRKQAGFSSHETLDEIGTESGADNVCHSAQLSPVEPKMGEALEVCGKTLRPVNSREIEDFIRDNKASLSSLDIHILTSMAKCYHKGNRSQSRFLFACPEPECKAADSDDPGAIGTPTLQSLAILEKTKAVRSLISSFFSEEKDLLQTVPPKTTEPEPQRYYRLFNQSYTFERAS